MQQCLFRADINTGTAFAPADFVGGSIQDQIFSVLCSAPLKSVEFEEAIDRLFTYDIVTPAALRLKKIEEALDRLFTYDSVTPSALTPMAPSPAGCKSGGLGAQDATAYDRGRECLPAPSCNIDTQDNISEVIATIVSNCNTPFVKMLQSMPARRR